MSTRHTFRLHLLCHERDVGDVSTAIRERVGDRVVGLVPQEGHPGLWATSGQWTPEDAAAISAACAGLPVRVVHGVLLGVIDEPSPERVPAREAFEAWSRDVAPPTPEKEGEVRHDR